MKRDMDMIRDLLVQIEDGRKVFNVLSKDAARALGASEDEALPQDEADKLDGHLKLIEDGGFTAGSRRAGGGAYYVGDLTWDGHEFLDTLRDPDRWEKTKGIATKAGGVGLKAMVEIGKSIAKGELQKLGIPMG